MKLSNVIFGYILLLIAIPLYSTDVQLAIDEYQPPFSFVNEKTGLVDGIQTQIVSHIFNEIGEDLQIHPLPWKRVLMMGETGDMGIIGIYKNAERLRVYDYTEPIFYVNIYAYTLKTNLRNFSNMTDLQYKSVGIISGWSYGDEFDKARNRGELFAEVNYSDELNFQKLKLGRIDCLLAVEESGDAILQSLNLENTIARQTQPLFSHPVYIVFNKKSNKMELIGKIDNYLIQKKEDGTFNQLVKKITKDIYYTLSQ